MVRVETSEEVDGSAGGLAIETEGVVMLAELAMPRTLRMSTSASRFGGFCSWVDGGASIDGEFATWLRYAERYSAGSRVRSAPALLGT